MLTSARSAALCIRSVPAPAVRSLLEHICRTSISGGCSNSAEFSAEQTGSHHRYNNIHYFIILKPGALCVFVFITHTYNCCREWLCDYHGNSLVSWLQLSGSAVLRLSQNAGGGCRKTEQNWTGAVTQPTYIQWNHGGSFSLDMNNCLLHVCFCNLFWRYCIFDCSPAWYPSRLIKFCLVFFCFFLLTSWCIVRWL